MVCLHGFGESADSFSFLANHLPDEFTVVAPELPWHGETNFRQADFSVQDFAAVLELMIPSFKQQSIYLLGYSMGARIALSLVEYMPEKISKVVLLAPDGLKINGWYWLATQTTAGNKLFRYSMQHPQWFAAIINLLNKLNFVNKGVAKYVHKYIDDAQVRNNLYHIWTTMRKFRPNIKQVQQRVAFNQISVHLVFGKYDRIIPYSAGYKLHKGCESLITIHEVQGGHLLLKEKHAAFIISLLGNE